MLEVRVETLGAKAYAFALGNIKRDMGDFKPVWPRVAELFYRSEGQQFSSQGSRGPSGRWSPLNPQYAKRKRMKWGTRGILIASGRMKASLVGRSADSIYDVSHGMYAELGTRVPYAIFHQAGTSKMPQRKLIDMTDRDQLAVAKVFQEYINQDVFKKRFGTGWGVR